MTAGKPHCLVVEDQALIAMSIEAYLEDEGFSVAIFGAASEALAAIDAHTPDCAVIDFALKDGPCPTLARELVRRGVPFVVYSGHHRGMADLPELEAVPWIDKPAPRSDLIAGLLSAMGKSVRPGSEAARAL